MPSQSFSDTQASPSADERRRLIGELPGSRMDEHFQSMDRALRAFAGNSLELAKHIGKFAGTNRVPSELDDDYEHELVRLFHNYLTSGATLEDVQRKVVRTIWPGTKNRKGNFVPSEWERENYSKKAIKIFGTDEIAFLQKLRDYAVHYDLPIPRKRTEIRGGPEGWFHRNWLTLEKSRLLKWDSWNNAAKRYIESQPDKVEFLPIIEDFSKATNEFYKWFWGEVLALTDSGQEDVHFSVTEYNLWTDERKAFRDWKWSLAPTEKDKTPSTLLRRKYAATKIERWKHGSRGWGVFEATSTGEVTRIEEDPWGLPPQGRG